MGNICKSPFWRPFASLLYGEQMQISVLGAICKSPIWGTFANLRFGGHLYLSYMGNKCKSPFWGPLVPLLYGEHLQISDMTDKCKSPIWRTNANLRYDGQMQTSQKVKFFFMVILVYSSAINCWQPDRSHWQMSKDAKVQSMYVCTNELHIVYTLYYVLCSI